MSYYHDPGRGWRDSAEVKAEIAVRQVVMRTAVRQGALAAAPSLFAIMVSVLVIYFACRAVGEIQGWTQWLAIGYLLALLVAAVVEAIGFFRALWTPVQVESDAPSLAELNSRRAWTARVITVPLGLLAIFSMTRTGFHPSVAVCFALIGWLGIDLATFVTFPARRTLHRLRRFAQPLSKDGPES